MATAVATTQTLLDQITVRIIKEQELIIGPVAWDEAKKVQGLKVADQSKGQVSFDGDPKTVLDRLVAQYSKLFGRLSAEVCKESVQDLVAELPQGDIPSSLR